jgi:hypothetical protein
MEEFQANYEQGLYEVPWIVYVGNNSDGYHVLYSNDENTEVGKPDFDFTASVLQRITNLENEKVFCYEDEYSALVTNGSGWVTNIDGTRTEVTYDPLKLYCIYEENGPENE